MAAIIYICTNEAMPGLIKIGKTIRDDVSFRIKELYQGVTSVPLPFECYYAADLENEDSLDKTERTIHEVFSEYRINDKREFFEKVPPNKIVALLKLLPHKDVTPRETMVADNDEITDKAIKKSSKLKDRRSATKLKDLGIEEGVELTFVRDENIKCVTSSNNKVIYEGQPVSLSYAARLAMNKIGFPGTSYAGPDYWKIDNETIAEIRLEKEREQEDSEDS